MGGGNSSCSYGTWYSTPERDWLSHYCLWTLIFAANGIHWATGPYVNSGHISKAKTIHTEKLCWCFQLISWEWLSFLSRQLNRCEDMAVCNKASRSWKQYIAKQWHAPRIIWTSARVQTILGAHHILVLFGKTPLRPCITLTLPSHCPHSKFDTSLLQLQCLTPLLHLMLLIQNFCVMKWNKPTYQRMNRTSLPHLMIRFRDCVLSVRWKGLYAEKLANCPTVCGTRCKPHYSGAARHTILLCILPENSSSTYKIEWRNAWCL